MINKILNKIKPIFQNDSNVAAVYIFGSHATTKVHTQSDIDLAILFEHKLTKLDSYKMLEKYFTKLARALKTEPDLVDLEQINLILLSEILQHGELLIENNRDRNRDFVARKIIECIDFQYIVKRCAEGMFRKAKEKISG